MHYGQRQFFYCTRDIVCKPLLRASTMPHGNSPRDFLFSVSIVQRAHEQRASAHYIGPEKCGVGCVRCTAQFSVMNGCNPL